MKKLKIIITIIICAVFTTEILAESNQPVYLKPIPPEKLKEDLSFLFRTIEEVHPNMYMYTSKEEFEPLRQKLYNQINQPMNWVEFYKITAPVVASLKSGHTALKNPYGKFMEYTQSGGKVIPLQFQWIENKPYIKDNYGCSDMPIGSEVIAINNQDAKELLMKFARYFASEGRDYRPAVIEFPNFMPEYLWIEYGSLESLPIEIKMTDKTKKEIAVKSVAYNELASHKIPQESSIRQEDGFAYRNISEINTAIIEITSIEAEPNLMKKFAINTFTDIHKHGLSNLIIDLRKGIGGNTLTGAELIKYLIDKPVREGEQEKIKVSAQALGKYKDIQNDFHNAKIGSVLDWDKDILKIEPINNPYKFTGKTFVLIGSRTFSGCVVFASIIKYYHIGLLIGEETSDTLIRGGNAYTARLPNSGLEFYIPIKYYVLPGGKPDGRGVIPDFEIKQKPEDTAKNIDTTLQFTFNLIKDPNFIMGKVTKNAIISNK